MYYVLGCVWGGGFDVRVYLWQCGLWDRGKLFVFRCCDRRECLCAGSGALWVVLGV